MEDGELFGEIDGDEKGLIGELCGFGGDSVEDAEGVGEEALAFAEALDEFVGLGKVEEVPVFLASGRFS